MTTSRNDGGQVMRQIVARRPRITLIEVESDLRSGWRNDFPPSAGYQVSVNELTDTFLYLSALLGASWAHGVTHLFLASEAGCRRNVELDGTIGAASARDVFRRYAKRAQCLVVAIRHSLRPR